MKIGKKDFDFSKHTYVMGILNVTPDSFSDGGKYTEVEIALQHAREMVAAGATIIDVGGESTRPGFTYVEPEEEMRRILPVIRALAAEMDVPISVDTYKPEVARAAVEAGAALINDVQYLTSEMAQVIAETGAACCLTDDTDIREEEDPIGCVQYNLACLEKEALAAGIRPEQILLDPGLGFGKTIDQNLKILGAMKTVCVGTKLPILLGTSKKSFLRAVCDVEGAAIGTVATSVMAAQDGVAVVRVHDVADNARAIRLVEHLRDMV